MKPSAPSQIVWIIGLVLGILGIFVHFVSAGTLSAYDFWLLLIGFALLAIGTSFRRA